MPQLLTKPLSWLRPDPDQPRKFYDEAELRLLGASLKVKQLMPVLCQPDGVIVAGERRYRAALLVGLPTLEVKIADEQLNPTQKRIWQFSENMQRADLLPIEQVNAVAEIARDNPSWSGKELAANLHLDEAVISRIRAIANCPITLASLSDGRLKGISDAYAIAKAATDQKAGLINLRLSNAVTRDGLARAAKPKVEKPPSLSKPSRISMPLPKVKATVVVTTDVASVDGLIGVLTEALELARKANRDGLTIKTACRTWADKASKTKGGS